METITTVDLHVFGDDSIVASCAVVNAVVHQPSATNQVLVDSKSRISKKNFTIPILELVKAALKRCNIRSITGWTDSTVVLHWLNRQGL